MVQVSRPSEWISVYGATNAGLSACILYLVQIRVEACDNTWSVERRHVTTPSTRHVANITITTISSSSATHAKVPSRLASNPAADATRITHSRRLELSRQHHTRHLTRPSLGTPYRRTHILLFLGHTFPLLYVSLPLFHLRTPTLALLLAFFYLAIGHRTAPLPPRPCPCPRPSCRAFGYNSFHCFLHEHRTLLLTSPRGLSPAR